MVDYKQTDIGLIPIDWEVLPMNKVASIKMGHSPKSSFYNVKKIGLPLIQGNADILNRKTIIRNYTSQITKICKSGDVIMSVRAPVGDIAKATFEACIGRGVCAITSPNEYLYHYLVYFEPLWKQHSAGSTIDAITSSTVNEKLIPLPPLPEQEAIAEVLSDTDALIGALEKRIAKKRLIKQGAMQTLLTPKDDWEVKKLGEVGGTYGGLSGKSKKDFEDGNYPYIPFMNIMSNPIIDKNYVDFVNIKKGEIHNKALKGDLFFNGSSETPEEVGMCSILMNDIPNLYLNSFCFGFRFYKTTNENGLFFVYYFRSNEGRKHFRLLAQGATRYNLSKTQLLKMEIPFPPIQEQNRIATILSDMDNEIDALEKKLSKTKELKQGLMQQLLTGKIRLV